MKTIIVAMFTCLLLFGVSLGISRYMLPASAGPETAVADASVLNEAENTSGQPRITAMPVSLRPDNGISVEAVLQMSDSIKKMEQQLIKREQDLRKKEQRVQLLFEDLETEQEELRAFSEGIDAKVKSLNQASDSLKKRLADMDAREKALQALAKKTGADPESKAEEFDNKVNDVKGWFSGLQADQAADYLKEFANTGKLEFAALLLQKMPDRQKSKILGAMNDPVLVDQLIDSLNVRKKPAK